MSRSGPRGSADEGSLSIEYVLMTPLIFLVLALIYLYARMASVDGNLDAATRDAARVASQSANLAAAQTAAQAVLTEQFIGFDCTNNPAAGHPPKVTLSLDFTAGSTMTVQATCQYSLSDIGLPGAPGPVTATSQFSSIIDPNRSLG